MNKIKIGLLLVFTCCFTFINAQSTTSLKINEVLINNQSNYVDGYGERVAWIEVFNQSYGMVNIEGCFLTNDKNNPTKFRIPRGNINTKMPPRQYLMFWADNMPNRGAFYLNFGLEAGKENYIALYDTDGETLIDEVTIPANATQANCSYARVTNGSSKWEIKGEAYANPVTPGANNQLDIENLKIQEFKEQDSVGVGMAVIAMSVVFSALVLLFLSFKLQGTISIRMSKKREMKEANKNNAQAVQKPQVSNTASAGSEDEIAAITMALHEHFGGYHDVEEMVLTFREVGQTNSPWGSKAFGMRQLDK